MLQGLAGLVIGVLVTLIVLSYHPQFLDVVRSDVTGVSSQWRQHDDRHRADRIDGGSPGASDRRSVLRDR